MKKYKYTPRYVLFKGSYWIYSKSISFLRNMIERLERGYVGKLVDRIGSPYLFESE